MCFSAGASFGASALLGGMGIVAIVKATSTRQRLFAAIPLIFSVQQLSEGMLWLSLKTPALIAWQPFFIYAFLVCAMAIWPLWIPFTIRLLEKEERRKKVLNVLVGVGAAVTVAVVCILFLFPVEVIPAHHHIHYKFDFPLVSEKLAWIFTILYITATIVAPFMSGYKRMKWLGVAFLASYIFTMLFYDGFVVSVWCYCAAVLSVVVLWIIVELRKPIVELQKQRLAFQ
jgi:hypothetical protein